MFDQDNFLENYKHPAHFADSRIINELYTAQCM